MKKFFCILALFTLPCTTMIGCGRPSGTTIVEGDLDPNEASISENQMSEYEAAMKSGEGSSNPGN